MIEPAARENQGSVDGASTPALVQGRSKDGAGWGSDSVATGSGGAAVCVIGFRPRRGRFASTPAGLRVHTQVFIDELVCVS